MDFMDIVKSSFFGQYKAHSRSLISSEGGKKARIKNQADKRRSRRIDAFISNRGLDEIMENTSQPAPEKVDIRKKQMLQWREERIQRKRMEPKKPPPFKAGVVTHTVIPFQEPIFKKVLKGITTANETFRRVTRSNTKAQKQELSHNKPTVKIPVTTKSFAPLGAKFHAPKITMAERKPTKCTPKATSNNKLFGKFFLKKAASAKKSSNEKNIKATNESQKSSSKRKRRNQSNNIRKSLPRKIFPPEEPSQDNISTPKTKITLKSTPVKTPQQSGFNSNSSMTSDDILDRSVSSPYVTLGRGKGNRQRESLCKLKFGYGEESPEKSAHHLRSQLDGEITRLQGLCDTWKSYQDKNERNLEEESKDLINLAIGQTQLLMNKKFQQFRGLIDQCENREKRVGEGIVTAEDLQGFWDMVFMQVVNVDIRFKRLEELKKKDWQEDDLPRPEVSKKVTVVKSKPAVKNPQSSIALKAMIQAARNRSKQNPAKSPAVMDHLSAEPNDMVTFDGVFFSVVSPSKTIHSDRISRSPAASPMRRSVITSEAKKRITSMTSPNAMAVVRATSAVRSAINPDDIFKDDQVSISNSIMDSKKTPGKGILKTPGTNKKTTNLADSRKSVKIIFFERADESPEENTHDILVSEPVDEKSPKIKKTYRQSKRIKTQHKDENLYPDRQPGDKRTTRTRKNSRRSSSIVPLSEHVAQSESNIVPDDSYSTDRHSRTGSKAVETPLSTSPFINEDESSPKTGVPRRLTRKRSMDDRKSVNLMTFETPNKSAPVTRRQLRR